MRRGAIWAAHIALFAACCFLAAGVVDAVLAELLLPPRARVVSAGAVDPLSQRSWSDRESILARNLFGARLAGEQEEIPEPEPIIELEETKLPLKLLGTVAGEDESVSTASIQDLGKRKHQVVFVGDALEFHPDARVVAIERGRVVLQNGPRREELKLVEDESAAPRQNVRTVRNARRLARRNRPRSSLSDTVEDLQRDIAAEQRSRTTAALYSQARIVPKWEEGEMVGVQLNQVKPGSLYEKIGIQSGDVITSLNGIQIDSPQASSRLLTEFTQAEEFRIEIEGGRTIDVDPNTLAELLEENES